MKTGQTWRVGMGDMQILPGPRHRSPMKRPMWIIVLVSLVTVFLLCAFMYPPQSSAGCFILSSKGCDSISNWLPPAPARELTDEELASHVVIREILNTHPIQSQDSKIAFMFLTPGSLPLEKVWEKFFHVRFCCIFFFSPCLLAKERDALLNYELLFSYFCPNHVHLA